MRLESSLSGTEARLGEFGVPYKYVYLRSGESDSQLHTTDGFSPHPTVVGYVGPSLRASFATKRDHTPIRPSALATRAT